MKNTHARLRWLQLNADDWDLGGSNMLLLQGLKIVFEMVFNVVKNYQVILFKSILEQNTAVSLRGHTVRRDAQRPTQYCTWNLFFTSQLDWEKTKYV